MNVDITSGKQKYPLANILAQHSTKNIQAREREMYKRVAEGGLFGSEMKRISSTNTTSPSKTISKITIILAIRLSVTCCSADLTCLKINY